VMGREGYSSAAADEKERIIPTRTTPSIFAFPNFILLLLLIAINCPQVIRPFLPLICHFGHGFIEDVEPFFRLLIGDDQGSKMPDDVPESSVVWAA